MINLIIVLLDKESEQSECETNLSLIEWHITSQKKDFNYK